MQWGNGQQVDTAQVLGSGTEAEMRLMMDIKTKQPAPEEAQPPSKKRKTVPKVLI